MSGSIDKSLRKIPIIRVEESTGLITVQWWDGLTALDDRVTTLEAKSSAGADLFTYQTYGAI